MAGTASAGACVPHSQSVPIADSTTSVSWLERTKKAMSSRMEDLETNSLEAASGIAHRQFPTSSNAMPALNTPAGLSPAWSAAMKTILVLRMRFMQRDIMTGANAAEAAGAFITSSLAASRMASTDVSLSRAPPSGRRLHHSRRDDRTGPVTGTSSDGSSTSESIAKKTHACVRPCTPRDGRAAARPRAALLAHSALRRSTMASSRKELFRACTALPCTCTLPFLQPPMIAPSTRTTAASSRLASTGAAR
mmetsp:Transcript_8879/g.34849  ORF Transcript_8879/g.34849 Transcript_8879/m.34849 type:complete len:250 (+) Transcript_8879:790-1539(+)